VSLRFRTTVPRWTTRVGPGKWQSATCLRAKRSTPGCLFLPSCAGLPAKAKFPGRVPVPRSHGSNSLQHPVPCIFCHVAQSKGQHWTVALVWLSRRFFVYCGTALSLAPYSLASHLHTPECTTPLLRSYSVSSFSTLHHGRFL
jgi:hypothetical protein